MDTKLIEIFGDCCGRSCLKKNWQPPFEIRCFSGEKGARKIPFGLISAGSLFLSREANSWDSSHDYGRPIDRSATVHDDRMLTLFRDHPHVNVVRLYAFCDCTVELEHIEGVVFDGELPWLHDHVRRMAVAREISPERLQIVIDEVRAGIMHIHDLGYAHTDVAGCNVMVCDDGTAKIIDILGSVPLTPELESFDWWVFDKWFCDPARRKNTEGVGAIDRWHENATAAEQELKRLLPPASAFILVDEDQFRHEWGFTGRAFPFLASGVDYNGLPQDDEQAIRALEKLAHAGACFIVFVWPCFWWLDYYKKFRDYLRSGFPCLFENERLLIFDLRRST